VSHTHPKPEVPTELQKHGLSGLARIRVEPDSPAHSPKLLISPGPSSPYLLMRSGVRVLAFPKAPDSLFLAEFRHSDLLK